MTAVVITAAKRSPMGAFQGILSPYKASEIAAHVIKNLQESSSNTPVDEVILGCVLSAGMGQAPSRQATIYSGLNNSVSATTINKVCGSGMRAIMCAADALKLGHSESIYAGGMESMSNAPYMLMRGRTGYRMGHNDVIDHMMWDGLEDAYHSQNDRTKRMAMGNFADATAEKYSFSREDQETFAIETYHNYQKAHTQHVFQNEIVSFSKDETVFDTDEAPTRVKIDKFSRLKPAFSPTGTVTAATSSSISDGASVLHLMTEKTAQKYNQTPLAKIVGYATFSREPEWFTLAPIGAIEKLLKLVEWQQKDVDLFEINEAFAVVPMAAIKELKLDRDRVNVHGGACTLGHPIGASGARVTTTLIHALKARGLKRGIASVCIGGGEATALAIEIM